MKLQGIDNLSCEKDPRIIEAEIIDFIIKMSEKGKGYTSLHNYVTAVLSFYKINDIVLNTNKISKFMPEKIRNRKDRAYTHEEVGKLLEIADEYSFDKSSPSDFQDTFFDWKEEREDHGYNLEILNFWPLVY